MRNAIFRWIKRKVPHDVADRVRALKIDGIGLKPEETGVRYAPSGRLASTVIGFVEAPRRGLGLPLDIRGTAFQERVWQALRDIPPGETRSYAQIAERIGRTQAARTVAQACASNKLAVAIPCHRVVRTDGSLSGYRWGVERKRSLLEREARS